jgi:hypothetical protein
MFFSLYIRREMAVRYLINYMPKKSPLVLLNGRLENPIISFIPSIFLFESSIMSSQKLPTSCGWSFILKLQIH